MHKYASSCIFGLIFLQKLLKFRTNIVPLRSEFHLRRKESLTFSKKQETSILQLDREDKKADSSHSIRGVSIGGIQQSSRRQC